MIFVTSARSPKVVPTELMQRKFNMFCKKYGFDANTITVDELLDLAINAEDTCRAVGPFDPAYMHFKQQQLDFEGGALYVETLKANA